MTKHSPKKIFSVNRTNPNAENYLPLNSDKPRKKLIDKSKSQNTPYNLKNRKPKKLGKKKKNVEKLSNKENETINSKNNKNRFRYLNYEVLEKAIFYIFSLYLNTIHIIPKTNPFTHENSQKSSKIFPHLTEIFIELAKNPNPQPKEENKSTTEENGGEIDLDDIKESYKKNIIRFNECFEFKKNLLNSSFRFILKFFFSIKLDLDTEVEFVEVLGKINNDVKLINVLIDFFPKLDLDDEKLASYYEEISSFTETDNCINKEDIKKLSEIIKSTMKNDKSILNEKLVSEQHIPSNIIEKTFNDCKENEEELIDHRTNYSVTNFTESFTSNDSHIDKFNLLISTFKELDTFNQNFFSTYAKHYLFYNDLIKDKVKLLYVTFHQLDTDYQINILNYANNYLKDLVGHMGDRRINFSENNSVEFCYPIKDVLEDPGDFQI